MLSRAAFVSLTVAASVASLGAAGCSSGSAPMSAPSPVITSADAGASDGDTWNTWAQAFFAQYCVECHSSGDTTGRDFTMKPIVVSNAPVIRCGVCNTQLSSWGCAPSPHAQQFPISNSQNTNPKPSAAERDRVVAWITAGCP